ncbi:MAG: DivIVA domain-containing protein [Oscillospiraceae bacterium]|nr:DivIVA domain-containing protein [Oscillospiraceae bacterium]
MTEVIFSERKNGYDKSQVDEYIKKIADAYREAYDENVALREKCEALMQNCQKLEEKIQNLENNDSEIIAKTLIDSENLAKKIVADAQGEKAKIMDLAAKSLESAYFALERAMDAVGLEAQKFFGGETKSNIEKLGGEEMKPK